MSVAQYWDGIYETSDYSAVAETPVVDRAVAFFGDLRGKSVLELGCGRGGNSMRLAAAGATVTAVDISAVAIEALARTCASAGITNIRPVHGAAMQIDDFGRFDAVFGSMILHHIEPFPEFAARLEACLVPGGKAFFYENNAASRLLVWFRRRVVGKLWVPKYGDPDEFPLTPDEVDTLRRHFTVAQEYPEMLFFRLAAVYLLRGRAEAPFAALDRFCFRHRILLGRSYRQYLMLQKR